MHILPCSVVHRNDATFAIYFLQSQHQVIISPDLSSLKCIMLLYLVDIAKYSILNALISRALSEHVLFAGVSEDKARILPEIRQSPTVLQGG